MGHVRYVKLPKASPFSAKLQEGRAHQRFAQYVGLHRPQDLVHDHTWSPLVGSEVMVAPSTAIHVPTQVPDVGLWENVRIYA